MHGSDKVDLGRTRRPSRHLEENTPGAENEVLGRFRRLICPQPLASLPVLQHAHHLGCVLLAEEGGRLDEAQDVRFGEERARNAHDLTIHQPQDEATRADRHVAPLKNIFRQAERLGDLPRERLVALGVSEREVLEETLGHEHGIIVYEQRRQVWWHLDLALGRVELRRHQLHQRRYAAAAVRAGGGDAGHDRDKVA